jgi:hypothetical protein
MKTRERIAWSLVGLLALLFSFIAYRAYQHEQQARED